jgi:hypothetical protein
MILGMIRAFIVASLLIGAMSAQTGQPLKVTFRFPEDVSDKAFIAYSRHDAERSNSHIYVGVTVRADHPSVEIPATTQRFRAQMWIPGCKMQRFDVPVEKLDIELRFVCDPLKTVPFNGRIKGVEVGYSAKISVSFMSMDTCMWLSGWNGEGRWAGDCLGPQIWGIASAAVAPDGTFKFEMPDLNADPNVSGDGDAQLEFRISGLQGYFVLKPQPSKGIETRTLSIDVSPSYPAEVTFLSVPLNDLSSLKQ